jgi:hypothetical protein
MPSRHVAAPARRVSRRHLPGRGAWIATAVCAVLSSVVPTSLFANELATVDVLIQDRARVTGPHLVVALTTAERLFRSAGVRLVWRHDATAQQHPPQLTIVFSSQRDAQLKASMGASHIGAFAEEAFLRASAAPLPDAPAARLAGNAAASTSDPLSRVDRTH